MKLLKKNEAISTHLELILFLIRELAVFISQYYKYDIPQFPFAILFMDKPKRTHHIYPTL